MTRIKHWWELAELTPEGKIITRFHGETLEQVYIVKLDLMITYGYLAQEILINCYTKKDGVKTFVTHVTDTDVDSNFIQDCWVKWEEKQEIKQYYNSIKPKEEKLNGK